MDKILNTIKKLIPIKVFKALQSPYHFLLSWFAAFIYRWPSNDLIVIGITGTTGKTTSTYLIAKVLTEAGYKVGYTSTAMFCDGNKEWLNDKKMTMVGRFFTQKILKQMIKNKCQYAIIETTSEGIRQFRHRFINYDILVFTCLYPEHIDSHGSFENYKRAKGKLFEHLKSCATKYINEKKEVKNYKNNIKKLDLLRVKKTIICNGDDPYADYFLNYWAEKKMAYHDIESKKEYPKQVELIPYKKVIINNRNTSFEVRGRIINLKLLGEFNATNAMNAVSLGLIEGIDIGNIIDYLEKIIGVPGRLELIDEGQNFLVFVDYAFEPKALLKLYEVIKLLPHNRVIHVLGATGGGRDVARRPKLGELAGRNADYVVVTNEDPYDDDPKIIIDQVSLGAENVGKKINENLFKILDRKEAIEKALSIARENDIVLITGKGSEQAICIEDSKKIAWDDRVVTRELLNKSENQVVDNLKK